MFLCELRNFKLDVFRNLILPDSENSLVDPAIGIFTIISSRTAENR